MGDCGPARNSLCGEPTQRQSGKIAHSTWFSILDEQLVYLLSYDPAYKLFMYVQETNWLSIYEFYGEKTTCFWECLHYILVIGTQRVMSYEPKRRTNCNGLESCEICLPYDEQIAYQGCIAFVSTTIYRDLATPLSCSRLALWYPRYKLFNMGAWLNL